jgi:hypothetical protein
VNPHHFRALVSSDWSECLSPNGPFDVATYTFPELGPALDDIFRAYTANRISLTAAVSKVEALLPEPITVERMDAYLEARFKTYTHAPSFIETLLSRNILFMLNTTGTHGYFQRAIAKKLLPEVPLIAANPMIAFPDTPISTEFPCNVREIEDKPRCAAAAAERFSVPLDRVLVIGDSGGDGPHFHWAHTSGALAVASMCKPSLLEYCRSRGFEPDAFFGKTYRPGEPRDPSAEDSVDFNALAELVFELLDRRSAGAPR